MSPGSKRTIQVEYQNTGDSTVYSAEARISVVDPFTSSSDIAYLGDLAPGQSAVASYQISVASDATIKEYGLDSEIRYHDALDDTYVSDPMKISIDVKNLAGIQGIVSKPRLYLPHRRGDYRYHLRCVLASGKRDNLPVFLDGLPFLVGSDPTTCKYLTGIPEYQ